PLSRSWWRLRAPGCWRSGAADVRKGGGAALDPPGAPNVARRRAPDLDPDQGDALIIRTSSWLRQQPSNDIDNQLWAAGAAKNVMGSKGQLDLGGSRAEPGWGSGQRPDCGTTKPALLRPSASPSP